MARRGRPSVEEDEPLVEVQTDKTTVEIPSPRAGTVLKILVDEGDDRARRGRARRDRRGGRAAAPRGRAARPRADAPAEPLVAVVPPETVDAVRATPAVRQLARELGVDLVGVHPTGPGGRIQESDVRASAAGSGDGRRVPIRGIRRAIVEQVSRAHREIPAVTFVEECDFTDVDVSLLVPLAIHASARALVEHPELNARLEGETSSFTTASTSASRCRPTPASSCRSCVPASVAPWRRSPRGDPSCRRRTRGPLAAEELRDSTFTVTSAGKLGGLLVTPLINYPEVAILGLHRIAERARSPATARSSSVAWATCRSRSTIVSSTASSPQRSAST